MRKIDKDGFILCELQAKAFEMSATMSLTSSEIFIRRFMNSDVAKLFDNGAILQSNIQEDDVLYMIEEQYGKSNYGTVKYSSNGMYWIGYIYRYFCFTYDLTSTQVYKIIKPKKLKGLYFAYHTLDPAQAIERIIEANHSSLFDKYEIEKQYELFKKIRGKQ